MSAVETAADFEHVVFEIAKGIWADTGGGFFRSLVRELCRTLQADLVFVGELQPGGERVRTLAVHAPGRDVANFEYDLSGTPCEGVIGKQLCCYPEGTHRLFPNDAQLAKMGAEGYVGAPLVASNGVPLGLISAITCQPLANPKLAEAVLQIFASRAGAEMERLEHEEALARTEQRWRDFVTHSNEAMARIALKQPISLEAPEDEQIEHYYQHAFVADCNDQAAALFGFASAEGLIGAGLETISPRSDPEQMQRLRAFVKDGHRFSQVERVFAGRTLLMSRVGIIEDGKLLGAWVTGRDVSPLKTSRGSSAGAEPRIGAPRGGTQPTPRAPRTRQCPPERRNPRGPPER